MAVPINIEDLLNKQHSKGEILDELREMANRIPFDERGNPNP